MTSQFFYLMSIQIDLDAKVADFFAQWLYDQPDSKSL